MALFSESMPECARIVLDTADIVREAMLRQLSLARASEHERNVVASHPIRHNLCVRDRLQSLMRDIIGDILGRIVVWGLLISAKICWPCTSTGPAKVLGTRGR